MLEHIEYNTIYKYGHNKFGDFCLHNQSLVT